MNIGSVCPAQARPAFTLGLFLQPTRKCERSYLKTKMFSFFDNQVNLRKCSLFPLRDYTFFFIFYSFREKIKDKFYRKLLTLEAVCDILFTESFLTEDTIMKHIKTLETRNLCESAKNGGCGECQTSCQSACKTSCGIANQQCENKKEKADK